MEVAEILPGEPISSNKKQMIKFNEQNLEVLTLAQCSDPAMKVRSQIEADQYLKDYANYILEDINSDPFKDKDADPYEIARTNLGYWAAYSSRSI